LEKREGIVYSTDEGFEYAYQQSDKPETLPPQQQNLRVSLDKSGRAGKQVTLISGFSGKSADLADLAKTLKSKCATGGAAKDGDILIQGDVRDKVVQILSGMGYRVKRSG
jgi:translation initiation factor 1 (eIF-1/SUI1)